ncbi:MAG TPA: Smr/MutS family protein, partial [Bacteroidales bacterium]|nr:Smr/MutS family protein [Bacteroidales bacterium]
KGTTEKTTDKNKVKNKPGQVEEVDLHIQEIVDDYTGMSNGEIINIQLARFTTSLEGAIRNNVKKIVFIHGVGNGKLKYELRKILDNKYPHLRYQDASFREYGYGATLVVISK